MPRYLLARDNGLEEEPIASAPVDWETARKAATWQYMASSAVAILVYEGTSSGAHDLVATLGAEGWEYGPGLPVQLVEVA